MTYGAANGDIIKHEGQKTLKGRDAKGNHKKLTVQLAKATKSLYSIGKGVRTGHKVVFDEEESYILHKASGVKTPLRTEKEVFVFDLTIPKMVFTGPGK